MGLKVVLYREVPLQTYDVVEAHATVYIELE